MRVTIGNLIDRLSIANQRIWAAEDLKRDPQATNKQIADATKITNVVNKERADLIQAIDEEMNEIAKGEQQKLYRQGATKMYGKRS
jgi:Protein of unknown function (DUF4254)